MGKFNKILKIALLITFTLVMIVSTMNNYSQAATYTSGVYFNLWNGAARPTGTYKVLTGSSSGNTKNVIKYYRKM